MMIEVKIQATKEEGKEADFFVAVYRVEGSKRIRLGHTRDQNFSFLLDAVDQMVFDYAKENNEDAPRFSEKAKKEKTPQIHDEIEDENTGNDEG